MKPALLLPLLLAGCSASQQAAEIHDAQIVLPYEGTVCSVIEEATGTNPLVTLACTLTEDATRTVASLPVPEAGPAAVPPAVAISAASLKVRVTPAQLDALLARGVRLQPPSGPASVPAAKAVVQAVVGDAGPG